MKFEVQPDENLQGRIKKGHHLDERIELSRCDDREYELLGNSWADGPNHCEKVEVRVFDLKDSLCSHCKRNNCGRIVLDQQPAETKPKKSSTFSRIFRRP